MVLRRRHQPRRWLVQEMQRYLKGCLLLWISMSLCLRLMTRMLGLYVALLSLPSFDIELTRIDSFSKPSFLLFFFPRWSRQRQSRIPRNVSRQRCTDKERHLCSCFFLPAYVSASKGGSTRSELEQQFLLSAVPNLNVQLTALHAAPSAKNFFLLFRVGKIYSRAQ